MVRLAKWLLDRVDSFPKNQRFIFGHRLADRAIGVLECWSKRPTAARSRLVGARPIAQIEVLRWLVRLAKDRKLLTDAAVSALPAKG